MHPILYGVIIFLLIAWIFQAWDVYKEKIFNPLGNYFATHGQLIWIAVLFWVLIFMGKIQLKWESIPMYDYLRPLDMNQFVYEGFVDNATDPDIIQEKGIDPLCGCPTAFPRDQRFSDGKTFTMGVKGSYFYPLPLKCGLPLGTCSKPIPTEIQPVLKEWDVAKGGIYPPPPEEPPAPPKPPIPPTYRDIHGVGPRSFWCIEEDKCVRHEEDPFRPWKNTCGKQTTISQVPPPVFADEASCDKVRDPCGGLKFQDCIGTERCGWCQDRDGRGKCVSGTAEGPNNRTLNCTPNLLLPSGAWIPGYADPYILEETATKTEAQKEWQFNPETQPGLPESNTPLEGNSKGWDRMRKQMTPPGITKFV